MKKTLLICISGVMLAFLTGCQHPGAPFNPYAPVVGSPLGTTFQDVAFTNSIPGDLLQPPVQAFTLGPGDKLEIELLDDPTSRTTTTVGPDGKIYFNLLPGIDVWGTTLPQAQELLQKQLSQFIRNQPRVAITLRGVESRRIWLLGRLQSPGVYFMTNSPTLLEAISLAGGTLNFNVARDLSTVGVNDDTADLHRSFVIRHGKILPVDFHRLIAEGDLSQNIYLQPDDFIYVPAATAQEVYVIGAVGQPRAVPYKEGMTMASAIADCFGTVREAYLSHVAVVRGSLTEPKIAIVDYNGVIKGETRDVLLQPHDIVYVPFEPYRYLIRYANLIVNTFVSSVAINEGVRSVAGNQASPTGVFIPFGSRISVTPSPAGTPGLIR
jgi:protein involved in polysaccharide export with SLBB domain